MSGRCLLKICRGKRHELSSFIGRKQTVKRITWPTIHDIPFFYTITTNRNFYIQDWVVERQRLLNRIKELEAENTELKKRLGEDIIPVVQVPTAMQTLSLQEKVDLFRSLFKGRDDKLKNIDSG